MLIRNYAMGAFALTATVFSSAAGASWFNSADWKLLELPGKSAPHFFAKPDEVLEVSSDSAVGFLYREIDSSPDKDAVLRWRWTVQRTIAATDQAANGGDDRPLAVHLWFDDDESGSLFGFLGRMLGYPKVGHLITYVWGGTRGQNTIVPNPHYEKGAIIILQNADSEIGRWYDEARDISSDYSAAFGELPNLTALRYMAISADTDDTRSTSTALISGLTILFSGRPE